LSAFAEVDNVWDFGSDNDNSTENGNTRYPVIADPTGTELNQLWLKYSGKGAAGTGGRQRILHGNQRVIGDWPARERVAVQAKYASFDTESERYADTDKVWLVVQLTL
jgi:hypothetical protein